MRGKNGHITFMEQGRINGRAFGKVAPVYENKDKHQQANLVQLFAGNTVCLRSGMLCPINFVA